MHIFRNIFKFSVKLKIKVVCKSFALPRECKTFANPREYKKSRQIDGKLQHCKRISVNLTKISVKPRQNAIFGDLFCTGLVVLI